MQQVVDLRCPGCGDRVSTQQKECDSCHRPIVISSFSTMNSMSIPLLNKYTSTYKEALEENPNASVLSKSIGMCYLKLKLYDKALDAFDKAIEDNFEDAESYYYAAICMLKGKKAFLSDRTTIDKIIEYLDAALSIEQRAIYYYFKAYVQYDYFARKYLKISPDYTDALDISYQLGVSEDEIIELYEILNVSKPEEL